MDIVYSDTIRAKCRNFWCDTWNGTRCSWKGMKKWCIPLSYTAVHRGPGNESSSHLNGEDEEA